MKLKRIVSAAALAACIAGTIVFAGMQLVSTRVHAADESESDAHLAAIGLRIAPSFIKMEGKDPTLVGLGSFIVNAQADCNGCHGSYPANEFLVPGNPYFLPPLNSPAKINQATYLNGGQNFGPAGPGIVQDVNSPLYGGPGLGPNIITRNLTPDYTVTRKAGSTWPSSSRSCARGMISTNSILVVVAASRTTATRHPSTVRCSRSCPGRSSGA